MCITSVKNVENLSKVIQLRLETKFIANWLCTIDCLIKCDRTVRALESLILKWYEINDQQAICCFAAESRKLAQTTTQESLAVVLNIFVYHWTFVVLPIRPCYCCRHLCSLLSLCNFCLTINSAMEFLFRFTYKKLIRTFCVFLLSFMEWSVICTDVTLYQHFCMTFNLFPKSSHNSLSRSYKLRLNENNMIVIYLLPLFARFLCLFVCNGHVCV